MPQPQANGQTQRPQTPPDSFPLIERDMPIVDFDTSNRTVQCTWTAGAQVQRYDWYRDRAYIEQLSTDPAHVDLSRLQSGTAPVLNNHNGWDLDSILGVVQSADIGNGIGTATLRFSSRDDVAPIWQDIQDKILCSVSLGARVNELEMIPPGQEGNDQWIYRAIDWQPYEISLVAVGADPDATIRSAEQGNGPPPRTFPCRFIERGLAAPQTTTARGQTMPDPNAANLQANPAAPANTTEVTRTQPAPTPADHETVRAQAQREERQRITDIGTAVRAAGLDNPSDLIQRFVEAGTSIDAVRAEVLRSLAERTEANVIRNQQTHVQVADTTVQRQEAMVTALIHRINPSTKLTDEARVYRGMSLREMCRDRLEELGVSTRGMSPMELAGFALGISERSLGQVQRGGYGNTSDLPLIFGTVIARTLRNAYQQAPKTFTAWARQSSINDFRPVTRVSFDAALKFEKIEEGGEYKYGELTEGGETYKLATYGKAIAFTRQMIINDDLSALERLPQQFGNAAAALESDIVYGVLTGNAKMSDGVALFDAKHGNLGDPSAITVDALSAGRLAMRTQASPAGTQLNLAPSTLLVPASLETSAWQMTSAGYTPTEAGKQNPFVNALTPVVESRLDADDPTSWYLMANNGLIDTIEYAYLAGEEGLFIDQTIDFDVDGVKVKARLDFAAKAIEHRGMYKVKGSK